MNTDTSQNTPETEGPAEASAKESAAAETPAEDFQAKFQEESNKYLYLRAEFDNFRRRSERDRLDFIKFGHESFLRELLQVLDNFERAVDHAKSLAGGEKGTPLAQVGQGVEMIHLQMLDALRNQGVAPLNTKGAKFDPAFHEAVGQEEAAGTEAGTIIREMQKGYTLHGRLLRPARVVIAQ